MGGGGEMDTFDPTAVQTHLFLFLTCSFSLSTVPFLFPVSLSPSRTSKQDLIGRRGGGGPDLDRQEVSVIAAGHI